MKKIYAVIILWLFNTLAYAQPQKFETLPIRGQVWHTIIQYSNTILSNIGVITLLGIVAAFIICMLTKAINTILSVEDNMA